eukprot:scaffold854_cov343-Prasinococcus_capsulatus_cf.AAC.7
MLPHNLSLSRAEHCCSVGASAAMPASPIAFTPASAHAPPSPISFHQKYSSSRAGHCSSAGASAATPASPSFVRRRASAVSVPRMRSSTCFASARVQPFDTDAADEERPGPMHSVRRHRQSRSTAPRCATAAMLGSSR